MNIIVSREEPILPPITKVTLELDLFECKYLISLLSRMQSRLDVANNGFAADIRRQLESETGLKNNYGVV